MNLEGEMRGAEPSPSPQGKLVVCHSPSARGLEYDSKSFVDKAHHDLLKCLLTSLFFRKFIQIYNISWSYPFSPPTLCCLYFI